MKELSSRSQATLLLTSHLRRRGSSPLTVKEFWDLAASVEDPSRLLGRDAAGIQAITGLAETEARRLTALLDGELQLAEAQAGLEDLGIRILTVYDDEYPERLAGRLGTGAPPVLHVAGDPALLAEDGVGIVGSRNVGREAREVAESVAKAAVAAGLPVVSGVARGIDQTAMGAALEAGGRVIGVPADAVTRLLKDASVTEAVAAGDLCLATPYAPSSGFTVGAAMGRNKLIYALSQVTLVVSSDDGSGGTWAGATETLQRKIGPVASWAGAGAGPGNGKLVRLGAVAVESYDEVLAISRPSAGSPGDEEQLRMIF